MIPLCSGPGVKPCLVEDNALDSFQLFARECAVPGPVAVEEGVVGELKIVSGVEYQARFNVDLSTSPQ